MSKLPKLSRKRQYICNDCATKLGGKWPEGHVATCSLGICGYCKKVKSTCSIGDYDWTDRNFTDLRD